MAARYIKGKAEPAAPQAVAEPPPTATISAPQAAPETTETPDAVPQAATETAPETPSDDACEGWRPSEYNGVTVTLGPKIQGQITLRFTLDAGKGDELLAEAQRRLDALQAAVADALRQSPEYLTMRNMPGSGPREQLLLEREQRTAALQAAAAKIAERLRSEAEAEIVTLERSIGDLTKTIAPILTALAVASSFGANIRHFQAGQRLAQLALRDAARPANNGG